MQPILDDYERGEYIDGLWRAFQSRELAHQQMVDLQAQSMPTCVYCHRNPCITKTLRGPICSPCQIALLQDSSDV